MQNEFVYLCSPLPIWAQSFGEMSPNSRQTVAKRSPNGRQIVANFRQLCELVANCPPMYRQMGAKLAKLANVIWALCSNRQWTTHITFRSRNQHYGGPERSVSRLKVLVRNFIKKDLTFKWILAVDCHRTEAFKDLYFQRNILGTTDDNNEVVFMT